jgi:hypothetical protein
VFLDEIEEALGKIVRVDVDRVMRVLAHAVPFFRRFYRGELGRTYNSSRRILGRRGKWKNA